MDFLQTLRAHTGGLVRIKSELFWYNTGWEFIPDRICLVLDAVGGGVVLDATAARHRRRPPPPANLGADPGTVWFPEFAAVLLLIDDRPQWVQVSQADVELL